MLLDHGANPNTALTSGTMEGVTPLMAAAAGGYVEVVKLLLAKGADVNARDSQGSGAVDHSRSNREILETLREHGAPAITTAAMKELFKDFEKQLSKKIEQSISRNESPDACRKFVEEQMTNYRNEMRFTTNQLLQARVLAFKTAFAQAAQFNMEENIKVGRVIEVSAQEREIFNQFVQWLKELQAELAVQREALLMAAAADEPGMVKWLLTQGADPNVKGEMGLSPLIICAVANSSADTARVLLDAGADVNLKGQKGWTATMFAASRGKIDILKVLVAKMPDVNATNDEGQTALALARGKNQTDAAVILKDAGATH